MNTISNELSDRVDVVAAAQVFTNFFTANQAEITLLANTPYVPMDDRICNDVGQTIEIAVQLMA